MRFTWDNKKAVGNRKKHGISFEETQTVFEDREALLIYDPDNTKEEDRFLLLGVSLAVNVLVVCHCYRESDELIRIISARKATKTETSTYERRK